MLGSGILDIAIGIVFIYLLLSLICTAVNEGIASILGKRSSNLFEGIKNLLNDPGFTGLAQQLYSHGMIDGISRDASNSGKPSQRPSYIPAGHFSLAMIDILGSRGIVAAAHGDLLAAAEQADDAYAIARAAADARPADQALKAAADQANAQSVAAFAALQRAQQTAATTSDQAVQAAAQNPADAARAQAAAVAKDAAATADAAVNMFKARRAAVALAANPKNATLIKSASDSLETALATARALVAKCPDPLGNLQAAIDDLPGGHTRESLQVLLDKTQRDVTDAKLLIEAFQKNIEVWFDNAMARVGGWYKRWTQQCLFALAVVVVVLTNADTIKLARRLSSDAALRSGLVAAADASAKKLLPQGADNQTDSDRTKAVVDALNTQAAGIHIPLGVGEWEQGWNKLPGIAIEQKIAFLVTTSNGWTILIAKLLGLLFSAFAVSLGAPFWFDTLSKIANVRGAGTPPGEAKVNARATSAATRTT